MRAMGGAGILATPGHGVPGGARIRRDPLLWALLAYVAVVALWFLAVDASFPVRVRVFWVVQVPLDLALSVGAWRIARVTDGVVRRFWRVLSGSALLWTTGDGIQAGVVLLRPGEGGVNGVPVQAGLFTVGAAALVVVMLAHPAPARSVRQRLAYWLDAWTILVGGVVLAWCFAIHPNALSVPGLVVSLAGTGVLLTSVFAAIKTALSCTAPLTRRAAAPMVLATVVQGVGLFVVPAEGAEPVHPLLLMWRVLPSVLLVVGPRVQELDMLRDPEALAPRPAKPYSLLPYVSIVTTLSLLLGVIPGGVDLRLWGVAIGTVVVTLLVVARQLLVFRDNASLIRRLDRTLVELRQHQHRLREQASVDGLTGLANRTAFGEAVTAALDDAAPGHEVTLLLIDLDDFKGVNDSLGHFVGDALLASVGDVLRTCGPGTTVVARLGGDEFAVLLRDVSAEEAERVASGILTALTRPLHAHGHVLTIRASIGLARAAPGGSLDALLRDADIAMYEAKDQGKGRLVRFTPTLGMRIQLAAQLTAELQDALALGQLSLQYQPIVRLADGRLTGVEALLRWRHPARGMVPPGEFVPVAERSGLIVVIGRWVLHEACRQLGDWRRTHPEAATLHVNVNVAGRQLRDPDFLGDVTTALADSRLPPGRLTVEVTETAALEDETALSALHGLRDLGVQVALDDFGTAASSLGLLLTCPVNTLKLDRSFVESVTTVRRQAAVATAVIEMANALGFRAVAEGVETSEQATLLGGLGYEFAQGFLFSRPLPPQDVVPWLGDRRTTVGR